MAKPTIRDVDALWGPATPHFAYQIAERVSWLVADLDPDDPVRRYAEERLRDLGKLGHDTAKAPPAGPAHH
jgi:hypothetical protein